MPRKLAVAAFLVPLGVPAFAQRTTGDIIAIAPALIVEDAHIDRIASTLREVLATLD